MRRCLERDGDGEVCEGEGTVREESGEEVVAYVS